MSFPGFENFKIEKKVANGLCYTLYRAIDRRNGNAVFLKVLLKELAQDQEIVANFINGARIARMVNHPNIAKVYNYGEDLKNLYISSEIIDLEPLKTLILDTFSLSLEDLTKIFTNIARTLSFAHLHGVAHSLLNPQNIYINSNSEIKIDDLGFSWCIPDLLKKEKKDALYISQYIAPEYYLNPQKADGRSDIYSLGAILFEFLNGKNPFAADDTEAIRQLHLNPRIPHLDFTELKLPFEFGKVIQKSLNKIPERRFQNLSEFVQAIEVTTEFPDASEETFPTIFQPTTARQQISAEDTYERIPIRSRYVGLRRFAFFGLGVVTLILVSLLLTTDFLNNPAENGVGDFVSISPVMSQSDSSNHSDEPLSPVPVGLTSMDSFSPANGENLSAIRGDSLAQLRTLNEPDKAIDPLTTSVDLQPKVDPLGTLLVNAVPKADSVFINGVHYDYKLPLEAKLPPGIHDVRLVNSDSKKSWQQSVTIKLGEVARVAHDFSIVELGKVAIALENALEVGFGYLYVDGKLWSEGNNTTPIEISLPVGSHSISVGREGYFCIPQDTTIMVEKRTPLYLSFHLNKQP